MEACVRLNHLTDLEDSQRIERNLHRILDVCIISINLQEKDLRFQYDDPGIYNQVVRELGRLGHPVKKCLYIKKDQKLESA